ncbi:MAG: hypothetical protein RBR73_06780 [Halothiobacillaceae bacterium]|jgi:hypothetical protein|nr:hypothetical protein [Halothiobacillaceae bacterium]
MRRLLLASLLTLTVPAFAEPLAPGAALPSIQLKDQHDKMHTVPADTSLLIFAVEKAPSDMVNEVLMARPKDFLAMRQAVFIADISEMPSFVTSMFALPKMRERPYPVLLGYEAADTSFMPRRKGTVTLIHLKDGAVTSVDYVTEAAALNQALDLR